MLSEYIEHLPCFLAESAAYQLSNISLERNIEISPQFISWNMYKTYLLDLAKNDVPVIPTLTFEKEDKRSFEEALLLSEKKFQTSDLVIKEVFDAAAFDYKHFNINQSNWSVIEDAKKHYNALLEKNKGAAIQPFCEEIKQKGELSYVFFGDSLSHVYLKVPAPNEERVQVFYNGKSVHFNEENLSNAEKEVKEHNAQVEAPLAQYLTKTSAEVLEIKKKINRVLKQKGIEPPLYLRIDGLVIKDKFHIMEMNYNHLKLCYANL